MGNEGQSDDRQPERDDRGIESWAPSLSAITPLELKDRREFNAARGERIAMSLELARARFLLKRIAGWTDYPSENPEHEARLFLKMYGHHPADWGEQGTLL